MSDDFVKNFIEGGSAETRPAPPKFDSPEGKKNADRFFGGLNKIGEDLGFSTIDDIQGMVAMALVTSYVAHHGTEDQRRRYSALMNYFVTGFPELEDFMEKIILLAMYTHVEKGASSLNDVFSLIPQIDPAVLSRESSKNEIKEEFTKKILSLPGGSVN